MDNLVMLNADDLEAFDYYSTRAQPSGSILDSYSDFVERMVLTTDRDRLAENALGLAGEAGEVAEKIKKFFRDGTLDIEAIQKELGDVIFYWMALSNALGIDSVATITNNMDKLMARKNNGTLRGSGDDR
jgi:NTP pyrophosphatase (non-canonical NTP hydrolase)